MSAPASALDTLYSDVEPLFGHTPEDPALESFLRSIGMWPVPPLGDEDLTVYVSDKKRGFSLLFDDSDRVNHPSAAGKPSRSRLFVAVYFYAEGHEGYSAFPGKLPLGITWADTPDSLIKRLGQPESELKSKKTGALTAHWWPAKPYVLITGYRSGGTALRTVYLGIK